jgi:hypothetical protein
MRRVRIALVAGLAILLAALAVVLSGSPLSVAGTNGVSYRYSRDFRPHDTVICSDGDSVPQGTEAVRVSLSANIGPRVTIRILSGAERVSEGVRDAGWGVDETVTIPVARVPRAIPRARICATVAPAVEPVQINGTRLPRGAGAPGVALRIEYLRPSHSSWLSLAASVAHHMGMARAPGGAWVAYLAIAVMIAICALAARLALQELR